ncbi:MAG TPA: sulfurtransferase [Gemmatimonadaceae bacterium]|nr:sulfurtransferase [Gemmatimonadaceae bacterium]
MPSSPHPITDDGIRAKGYARPDALVSTAWLAAHLDDPQIRIIESDEDVLLYDSGHIPRAQKVDWHLDLNDPITRDYVDRERFQALVRRLGVDESTTVVFYGDKNNWWATYSYWVFKLFAFKNAKILDGGRVKWEEEKRPLVTSVPSFAPSAYVAPERDDAGIRAFRDEVVRHAAAKRALVDVRSPNEFSGKTTHMAEYPQEGVLRGGHVPGAKSIPWARAANPDGTFKPASELRAIYENEQGLAPTDDVISYCRIGERSSHTWFVLSHLLGYEKVRNYDGSWTEWGNSVRLPIER